MSWCLCGGYDWPGNPRCPGNKPPEFTWPEASDECEAARCDHCAGCDCPCHE